VPVAPANQAPADGSTVAEPPVPGAGHEGREVLRRERTSSRKVLGGVGALIALGSLFWVGAWLYVHVAGRVLGEGSAVPAPLLLALAVVGGAASFFSPCSIAITPSFLLYLLGEQRPDQARLPLRAAALVALGIVSFYALAGLFVGAVGAVAYNYLVYLVAAVGLVFVALGYALLSGGSQWLQALAARNPGGRAYGRALEARGKGSARLYAFGCAYGAASHTCTLPIFLGIALAPLTTGAFWLAPATTVLYGASIAALLLALALLGERVISGVRRRLVGHWLELATGALFIATGAYLVYYFLVNYGQLS